MNVLVLILRACQLFILFFKPLTNVFYTKDDEINLFDKDEYKNRK